MGIDRKRLKALEARLGGQLPREFVTILTTKKPIRQGNVALVTPDQIWDVRTTFCLDDGRKVVQIDRLYELVGDVLPPAALPFASDWGDNFYCLMVSGPQVGQVVWWDHERDRGDHSVEPVAVSIADFHAKLVPDPRE